MPRAIDAVLGQPWAIQPEWLSLIAALADRQFDAPAVAAMRDNPPRAGESGLAIDKGVAVIGIIGPIFPRANMMTEVSGATSLANVQAQFRLAVADPAVTAIVLNVDSPGGVTTGIGDFAAEVARARPLKPVTAVVGGQGASAAYWIATAASSIVISPTAMVGSIGVVMGTAKQVAPDANGRISVDIVSTNAPDKRPDATDSAGRAALMNVLDAVEAEFINAVALNRGVSPATVKSDFGKGGVLVGARAVAAGMADRIGTIDSVLTGLHAAGSVYSSSPRAAAAAAQSERVMNNPTSVAELTAAFPDLVAQIRADAATQATATSAAALATATDAARAEGRTEGRAEGAAAERERILGIEANALPGHDALVAGLKADGKTTPGEAAIAVLKAEKAAGAAVLAAIATDGARGPAVGATGAAHDQAPRPITAAEAADQIEAMVAKATAEGKVLSYAQAGANLRAQRRAAA